jgi:uncharacterized protein involved in exopolysaccharide biosynthesis
MTAPIPAREAVPGLLDDSAFATGPDAREVLGAMWARRARLAAGAFAGAAVMIVAAFVMPPVYVAGVSMLEAPRDNGGSALDKMGISAQVLGLGAGGGTSNALTYPDLLRSRRLLSGLLAARFPTTGGGNVVLQSYLVRGAVTPQRTERALRRLRDRLDISLDRRTNLLRLSVSDRDPVLAAAVANAAAASLQDLVMTSLMTQAGANRRFVETRLETARTELSRAEAALEGFRDSNRHVSDSPRLLLEQARLMREVRTREEVLVALTREYEIARVDENRDVPVLNVLDAAQPPAFRSSPRRTLMAAAGLLLGLCAGAVWSWPRRSADAPVEHAEAA